MTRHPTVVVFDVNETLSDMSPMATRFADVGAEPHLARLWFATLLRDGFALTAAGGSERFSVLGDGVLRQVLSGVALDRDLDDAVAHVMGGFARLPLHPDVPDGVRAMREAGLRLVNCTRGTSTGRAGPGCPPPGSTGWARRTPTTSARRRTRLPGSPTSRLRSRPEARGLRRTRRARCARRPGSRRRAAVPRTPAASPWAAPGGPAAGRRRWHRRRPR